MFKMTEMMIIFLIIVLGYALGRVKVSGLSLGSSGVLIVALVFGHFGLLVPGVIKDIGLILFVAAVGVIAGPVFVDNFKHKATAYILLGIIIILLGAATMVISKTVLGVSTPLGLGIMTGSLTSTPGLAAALEATGDELASIGYGIAYPFGVIGVVLFVEILPKIAGADIEKEIRELEALSADRLKAKAMEGNKASFRFDGFGYFAFAVAIVLGILLGQIKVPLPGGGVFSLGNSGGPLIMGLVIGNLGHIGPVDLSVDKKTLEAIRELGLILFLMGTGTQAGQGLIQVLMENGIVLFFMGVLVTLIPMIIGYFVARKVFKLGLLDTLGSITGGMTSTPALGALVSVSNSDAVGASYAATYPIALIMVVLSSQFISILFP
ncbi:MAG: permease [Tissierellia bacterium]|nr:permease [Tissierellia bacterium]